MGKSQDPGSGVNIPDPLNWILDRSAVVYSTLLCAQAR
jgi:hypothetical protein